MGLVIQSFSQVIDGDDELGFTGSALPKPMLGICEHIVGCQVLDDGAVHDVLTQLTQDRCQGDGLVVCCTCWVALLEDGDN